MVIGFLYFIFAYYGLTFFEKYINDIIKKSSVHSYEAKKNVFSWFFTIVLCEIVATMFYIGSEVKN